MEKKLDFCAGAWGDGHHYWDLVDPDTKKAGESENHRSKEYYEF